MGLLSSLLGRTKPVQSNLDALFALPSASITLQSAAGMSCSGHAGVCFKPPTRPGVRGHAGRGGQAAVHGRGRRAAQGRGQLRLPVAGGRGRRHRAAGHPDPHGQLLPVRRRLGTPAPVLGVRAGRAARRDRRSRRTRPADPALPEPTAGPGHACCASTAYLVYLFKRGTFYPFVPDGHERRDTEEELKLRSLVADDLVVETDLDRWFPLWDLPVG